MKLSQYTIVLFCLLFSITSSYAEINIEKCKTNESDYIIFDEYDSQIAEKIIDYKLHNQPEKRESSIIKIFANENSDDRNYWLASFQFDDQTQQYLFFQVEPETFIEIDKNQFEALLPKIVECNQNKQLPIYSENFDED
ncbi:hypothetical protein [Gilliamella apicola]|uniref:Uncharacterized protein n=1 Tax=Gilliamella apicola TaxID=1196095 RepID=A0A242NGL0_9GAMM|nr:hypothetical protein [Gilliamella apicola]OCG11084.1 hypothetical protein A9G14_08725 [Gilliamella apicola]ORF45612.1 hypothetical protein B5800_06700 [Gilliamella apicola]ORF49199.1 hypothetical protein B5799_05630 [Gilliamella apicola]ORF54361.1 hypothetical protein B5803_01815 [Gilliamella apicola]ORF54525.1 hypothetical protein B5798_06235 [Gilliamella apicola]